MDRLGVNLGLGNRWVIGAGLIAAIALLALMTMHPFTHAAPAGSAVHHSVSVTSSNDNGSTNSQLNSSASSEGSLNTSSNVSSSTAGGQTRTTVTVNGQDVPVPQNGSVTKTVPGQNGSVTSVNVNNQTSGDAGNSYNTSVNVVTNDSSSFTQESL